MSVLAFLLSQKRTRQIDGCVVWLFSKSQEKPLWKRHQIIGGDIIQKACLGRAMHVEESSQNQCAWGEVPWRYTKND
jgi:hypothetical protein